MWAGQAGACTPLHFDLCHGLIAQVVGRGLHSSTFRLNLSAFCGRGVHYGSFRGCLGGDRGY